MHTMGRLFIALFSLLLAILLGGLGAALSLWVAAGAYRSEWALRPALWAVEHTPLPLYASASRVASSRTGNTTSVSDTPRQSRDACASECSINARCE